MALRIKANTLVTRCYLQVDSGGVEFCETATLGGVHRFQFSEVVCILMAPDGKLSFQAGREVFSLATKPANKKHKEVIDAFVLAVRTAAGAS